MIKKTTDKKILLIHFNRFPPTSGGELTYFKIFQAISSIYNIKHISTSNILYKYFNKKFQRRINRCIIEPASIIYPLIVNKKYDLIFTSWSDYLPYYGDLVYAQPIAGAYSKKVNDWELNISKKESPIYNFIRSIGENYYFPEIKLMRWFSLKYMDFISNSLGTKNYIKKNYNKDSIVVYPPVNVDKYLLNPKIEKENIILSIGRVVQEKRYHLIGIIGPFIKNAKFVLIGDVLKENQYIIDFIEKQFKKHGRKSDFIYYGKTSEKVKTNLLLKSKVLFHPAINEAFGISIIEGMAAGAVPIVHNSGGPTEFLSKDNLFDSNEEAIEKIQNALTMKKEIRKDFSEYSLRFSDKRFKKEILTVIDKKIR